MLTASWDSTDNYAITSKTWNYLCELLNQTSTLVFKKPSNICKTMLRLTDSVASEERIE